MKIKIFKHVLDFVGKFSLICIGIFIAYDKALWVAVMIATYLVVDVLFNMVND